jgi:hypothetical protein
MTIYGFSEAASNPAAAEAAAKPPRVAVPREYLPLHKYLAARFADVVVLRLVEMEDLLGWKLPAVARIQPEWWANPEGNANASAQSAAWTQAGRTAIVNLAAMKVTFDRLKG